MRIHLCRHAEAYPGDPDELRELTRAGRDGAKVLGPDTPAGGRFAEAVEFFDFLQEELRLMTERWNKRREERAG